MLDRVAANNADAEYALVGSLLAHTDQLKQYGATIDPEWFAEGDARHFYEAIKAVFDLGSEPTQEAVLGHLPDSANADDPLLLRKLYIELIDRAAGPDALPGLLSIVRDRWARRHIIATCQNVAKDASLYGTNPFDLVNELLAQADRVHGARKVREGGTIDTGAEELVADLASGRRVRVATTGIKSLDDKIGGGYRAGQLYVIAARPGMGKSAFGLSSGLKTATAGHGVLFFSMEMTKEEVIARCLSDAANHPFAPGYGWIMQRKTTSHQIEELRVVADSIGGLPLYFDYTPSLTLREIAAESRRSKAELEKDGRKLDAVFVDHLTIMQPDERYRGNPVMEVSQNIDGLRALAKELDTAFIVLCQLSREVEKRNDKKPQLSDLRWTGEIEQAAHVVAFLYREEYYLKSDPKAERYALQEAKNAMDFLIRKNRQGETCDINLWCDMAHSSVRDQR